MKETSLPASYAEMLLRWGLGLLFLLQGVFKFFQISEVGYAAFVSGMAGGFSETILPMPLVNVFFFVLPVVEVALGFLLLIGYERVKTLLGTGILVLLFLFGHLFAKIPFDVPFVLLFIVAGALALPAGSLRVGGK